MFVGIDPSFTGTGIVLLASTTQYIYDLITSPATHTWAARIERIWNLGQALSQVLPETCERVALEGYSHASGYRAHHMGELGFCYRSILLKRYGDGVVIVPPTTIKKFITGDGHASKDTVAEKIEEQFGWEFENLNVSDACALALFAYAMSHPEKFENDQMAVVKKWGSKTT